MATAAIYTGGINHPFDTAAPALARLLDDAGFTPLLSHDLDEVIGAIRQHPESLLVVYALRWSMTQHEKYAPHREQWAFAMPDYARAAIDLHVATGGGLLAVHTASICFDDWPEWSRILGGGWRWGRSHHPPLGPVRVLLTPEAPLARGLPDFELVDEVYADLELAPGACVLARAEAEVAPGTVPVDGLQAVVWTHAYGRGRVVYDGLGHDAESLTHPIHRRLLQRAALWASGRPYSTVEAA